MPPVLGKIAIRLKHYLENKRIALALWSMDIDLIGISKNFILASYKGYTLVLSRFETRGEPCWSCSTLPNESIFNELPEQCISSKPIEALLCMADEIDALDYFPTREHHA